MHDGLRTCIAYIAAHLGGASTAHSIYDRSSGERINVSGTVSPTSVAVYDHERGANISGTPSSLYDHSLGAHVSLSVTGTTFSGYDHASHSHFSGTISANSVSVYDHDTKSQFNYSL